MLLSESYKNRLKELAGIKQPLGIVILEAVTDLYANSGKRVKFDINIMTQAIEGGMEVGLIFQSNNDKYTMPIWKTRIVQPVAMGYDKKGQLVIRGVHIEGQSEKKAIQTGVRSAQAINEWRLFKVSNIKSMFLTGRSFDKISLPGYNPNDSAMTKIIVSFDAARAKEYQQQTKNIKKNPEVPIKPIPPQKPVEKKPVPQKTNPAPVVNKNAQAKKELEKRIDKLKKFL